MPYYCFKPTILTGVSLEDHVSAQQQSEVLANIYHNLISLVCDIRRATLLHIAMATVLVGHLVTCSKTRATVNLPLAARLAFSGLPCVHLYHCTAS